MNMLLMDSIQQLKQFLVLVHFVLVLHFLGNSGQGQKKYMFHHQHGVIMFLFSNMLEWM